MKYALIIIDMQNWFFRLANRRKRLPYLKETINELIGIFKIYKLPIYHVITVHKKDKTTWTKAMKRDNSPVLIEDSYQAKEVDGIIKSKSDIIIKKTRMSTFSNINFNRSLINNKVDTLIITGVYSHSCVSLTAIDASEKDHNVIIAKDATYSYREDEARMMLDFIKRLGERVLDNKSIIEEIKKNPLF